MASPYPMETLIEKNRSAERRRSSGSSSWLEDFHMEQQSPQRLSQSGTWYPQQTLPPAPLAGNSRYPDPSRPYGTVLHQSRHSTDEWNYHQPAGAQHADVLPSWQLQSTQGPVPDRGPVSAGSRPSPRASYSMGNWPGPLLRRISSEDASLRHISQGYYENDMSSSVPSLSSKAYPQRRPSNRDEFDGPSQFLDKPIDSCLEPKEDEMPALPVSLHAQEQDYILTQVNDTLSQCAFDFVAKYQFPIPIESDKRPVRVANDREWSEWVYLLKRLATKRRIPSRVLYGGQIKQLITILENSLEMRHAAKHQSRPLKDDRNVLQLISSGIQVAKIVKDAPAMETLDRLYVDTEQQIHGRQSGAMGTYKGILAA